MEKLGKPSLETTRSMMDTMAALLHPVRLGAHFEITAQGLVVKGKPTFDDCEGLWETLLTTEKTIQFVIGDAMKFFREYLGDKADQIISDRVGWTLETLRNYEWCAEKIPQQNRRLDKLSFTHHLKVAKCSPREQQRWLNKAADDETPWSAKRLGAAVKAGEDLAVTTWVVIAFCDSQDARDALQKEIESKGIRCEAGERRGERKAKAA